MTPDPWKDAARLLENGAFVAAGVVALLALLSFARRPREPAAFRPRSWPVPWTGFEVVALILAMAVAPSLADQVLSRVGFCDAVYGVPMPPPPTGPGPELGSEAAVAGGAGAAVSRATRANYATVRMLWANVVAVPLLLGAAWASRLVLYPDWIPPAGGGRRTLPDRIGLAGRAWLVLMPAVFAVHFAALALASQVGPPAIDHPLTAFEPGGLVLDRVLFILNVCVVAPWVEETVFRGVVLPWAVRRPYRVALTLAGALAVSLVLAGPSEGAAGRFVPAVFAAVLGGVWLAFGWRWRYPRTRGGVWASAALFAAVHANVWPSPVPLFALGLGLGWLAVRTRGVFVPAVVHGLFNAVSAAYVLRGGAG